MAGKRVLLVVALMVALLSVVGCLPIPTRIELPPVVELGSEPTLAVVYWDNYTIDPGLSLAVEEALVEHLQSYYKVLDPLAVQSELVRMGVRRGMPITQDMAVEIGQRLGADAVFTGDVAYFYSEASLASPQEEVHRTDPQRSEWTVVQTTRAVLVLAGRLYAAADGSLLYSGRGRGTAGIERVKEIPWWRPEPPPAVLLPGASGEDLPRAREAAIAHGVNVLIQDLLPRYQWQW